MFLCMVKGSELIVVIFCSVLFAFVKIQFYLWLCLYERSGHNIGLALLPESMFNFSLVMETKRGGDEIIFARESDKN